MELDLLVRTNKMQILLFWSPKSFINDSSTSLKNKKETKSKCLAKIQRRRRIKSDWNIFLRWMDRKLRNRNKLSWNVENASRKNARTFCHNNSLLLCSYVTHVEQFTFSHWTEKRFKNIKQCDSPRTKNNYKYGK